MSHVSVQTQAVTKLHDACIQKLKLGYQSHKIPELQQIWNNIIHSPDAVTSSTSCKAIMILLQDGILNINEVLETIVNYSPSSHNTQWLVHLVIKVLKLQFYASAVKSNKQSLLCFKHPYGLVTPTHPLIAILISAPHSWTHILTEIQTFCFDCIAFGGVEADALQILLPFFVYVFFNPSTTEVDLLHKTALFSAILNYTSPPKEICCQHAFNLFEFLGDIVTYITLTEVNLQLFVQFYTVIAASPHSLSDNVFVTKFCLSILSSCFASTGKLYITSIAQLLYQCMKSMIQSIHCVDVILLGLSDLICRVSEDTLKWLLNIILLMLPSPGWKLVSTERVVVSFGSLKAALLQLLLNKSPLGFVTVLSLINKTLTAVDSKCRDFIEDAESSKVETTLKFEDLNKKSFISSWLSNNFILLENFEGGYGIEHLSCVLGINTSNDMVQKVTLLTCGVLHYNSMSSFFDKDLLVKCLNLLCDVASIFPSITFIVLPSILYFLKIERNPQCLQNLAFLLPKLAIHKECLAPILGTIQAFYKVTSLQPLSLYLLMCLWKKQERCFPYLHKTLLQKSHFTSSLNCELNTVKVIVLREICKTMPFKNTGEILAMVSSMLKSSLVPTQAVFLVEGLYYLLENKLVDIHTTWLMLKDTIMSYKSNSMTIATLRILSLVPKLEVNTVEYARFKEEIISWLWSCVDNQNTEVLGNALISLSFFKVEDFKIRHFPKYFRPEMPELPTDESEEEFEDQLVPGSWYLQLMKSSVLSKQAQFLFTSILDQEIENFPRDIKDRALKSQRSSSSSSLSMHSFILNIYERNKQPNLKSSIAFAVLMCYNPTCDSQTPKHMVSLSRNVLKHLQALLSDVIVDTKNWSSILWLAHAWKNFMQKSFGVMVEGRRAELQMQLQQKDCDLEDIDQKLHTSHFWCRDKITDTLKTASKGTPSMQGNAILALAGLMCALKGQGKKTKEGENTSEEKGSTGFLSYHHWCGMAADTLISISDSTYRPSGRMFSWCQYRAVSSTGKLTTSVLGKICAMHSFAMIASIPSIRNDNKRMGGITDFLWNHVNYIASGTDLENDESDLKNPTIALHLYLSFATLIAQLFNVNFHEVCDPAIKQQLFNSTSLLHQNVFNPGKNKENDEDSSDDDDNEHVVGSLIGIGLILPSMFSSENMILRGNAVSLLHKLDNQFESIDNKSTSYQNAFILSFTRACVAGRIAKAMESDFTSSALQKVHTLLQKHKTNAMFSQSAAVLCSALYFQGETPAMNLFDELFDKWYEQANAEKVPTRQKLSCINGLAALVGSESMFILSSCEHTEQFDSKRNKIIQLLQRLSRNVKESGIANNAMLLLGHLYLSSQNNHSRQSSIPSSFAYLPDSSILKPIFQIIIDVRSKDDDPVHNALLKVVLTALSDASGNASKTLPPVVWSEPFSTLMQLNMEDKIQDACFSIALFQCKDNQSAAAFINKWIHPTQFKTLSSSIQCTILKHLSTLVSSLPTAKVILFIESAVQEIIQSSSPTIITCFLQGLVSLVKIKALPSEVPICLFCSVKKIIEEMTFISQSQPSIEHWTILSECFTEYDDFSNLLNGDINANSILKVIYVKCYLVPQGFRSIQWLNDTLEASASCNNLQIQIESLWIIYHCMKGILSSKAELCSKEKMIEWLQELMGYIRKIIQNKPCFLFFMKIFSVTVIAWNNQFKHEGKYSNTLGLPYDHQSMLHLWNHCLKIMPIMLQGLLNKTSWKEKLFLQMIEWLLYLYQNTTEHNDTLRSSLKQCILELQQDKLLYNKSQLWKNVAATLML